MFWSIYSVEDMIADDKTRWHLLVDAPRVVLYLQDNCAVFPS